MRAAIASGLQEFAELLAEDIPTVCPDALLQVITLHSIHTYTQIDHPLCTLVHMTRIQGQNCVLPA